MPLKLNKRERKIFDMLDHKEPADVDDLIEKSDLSAARSAGNTAGFGSSQAHPPIARQALRAELQR